MDRIEYLMKNYSDVKLKLALVENQLLNFRPISEESVIQSLVYEKTRYGEGKDFSDQFTFRDYCSQFQRKIGKRKQGILG